jgi:hypothetical protein
MRAFDQGALMRVTVSAAEVYSFAQTWPCFGPCRALSFVFDREYGDLLDLHGDSGMDDHGVLALAEDAYAYGLTRIKGAA